jgi:parvulin-like peptidyl-prolyl isomerase
MILEKEGRKRGIHLNDELANPGEVFDQSKKLPDGFQILEQDGYIWKQSVKKEFFLMKVAALLAREMAENIRIPEEQVKEIYEKNKEKYVIPEILTVRIIRVFDIDLAKDIWKKLKKGWRFTRLAETYSTLRDKGAKGKPVRQSISEFPYEFQAELSALKPRQISPILHLDESYYIFKLEKKEPSKIKSFEEVRESIQKELVSQRANELFKNWLNDQVSKMEIRIGTPVPFPGDVS